jgi:hypothetical protein
MLIPHVKYLAMIPLLLGSALSGTFVYKKINKEPVDDMSFQLSVVTLTFFFLYLFYFTTKKAIFVLFYLVGLISVAILSARVMNNDITNVEQYKSLAGISFLSSALIVIIFIANVITKRKMN